MQQVMRSISIIIPVYNEEKTIASLINYLFDHGNNAIEVLVIDGGSTDATLNNANSTKATALQSQEKGRAAQMHFGATQAKGDILYFVHADTLPPKSFVNDILQAVENGFNIGRYQTRFDSRSWFLKLNAFFTRFDLFVCMGGDQTLFITKELYNKTEGFNTNLKIMEEFEFCQRARALGKYKILNGKALISARKYNNNSWWQVQKANYTVVNMFKKGAPQQALIDTYKQMLKPY